MPLSSNSTGTSFPVTSSRTCWRRRQLPRNKLATSYEKVSDTPDHLDMLRWSESRQLPRNFLVTSWRLPRNICYGEVTGNYWSQWNLSFTERLRGVFTTRRYTNSRLPYLTLPYPIENLRNNEPSEYRSFRISTHNLPTNSVTNCANMWLTVRYPLKLFRNLKVFFKLMSR